jgi:uncharacterized Zn finger protein
VKEDGMTVQTPRCEEKVLYCPVCHTDDIRDISLRQNNGVYGPGFSSWKVIDLMACNQCGTVFTPYNLKVEPKGEKP